MFRPLSIRRGKSDLRCGGFARAPTTLRTISVSRILRQASLVAIPALTLALLPFTGLSISADAASPAKAPQVTAAGPDDASVWTATSAKPRASLNGHRRADQPERLQGLHPRRQRLRGRAGGAPLARSKAARSGAAVEVVVPAPTGELVTFSVVESPVMQRKLQAKHPDIRTYVGNEARTGDSISLVVTPTGVHASVRGRPHVLVRRPGLPERRQPLPLLLRRRRSRRRRRSSSSPS